MIIAGNWKMHMRRSSAQHLVSGILEGWKGDPGVEMVLCPPLPYLSEVGGMLEGSDVRLGGQNCHFETDGAFTGEVSAEMLADVGCAYVILGHSERRHVFNEPPERIAKSITAALKAGLKPILCVGETLEEREGEKAQDVVRDQLESALAGHSAQELETLVIAYEPVWAIGTGKNATPQDASAMHRVIRDWLSERFGSEFARTRTILYGGSVKPENAGALLSAEGVDGALVGGASLKADAFVKIAHAALNKATQGEGK